MGVTEWSAMYYVAVLQVWEKIRATCADLERILKQGQNVLLKAQTMTEKDSELQDLLMKLEALLEAGTDTEVPKAWTSYLRQEKYACTMGMHCVWCVLNLLICGVSSIWLVEVGLQLDLWWGEHATYVPVLSMWGGVGLHLQDQEDEGEWCEGNSIWAGFSTARSSKGHHIHEQHLQGMQVN